VDRFFPTIPERRGRAVGGLSMGGYGAMKLALKYPDRFCSVVSHSSVFDIAGSLTGSDLSAELRRIFGGDPGEGNNDVFRLAESAAGKRRRLLPAIRFDCGRDDGLIEHNRAFHRHLDKLRIKHQYEEFPGTHDWSYWDTHIQEALKFHAAVLGI
jgi:S-formylglutathione hydrolase FrmB